MAEAASWKTAAAVMAFAVAVMTARASWLLSIICFPLIALLCCYAAGVAVDTIAGDGCDELRSWRKRQAYKSLSFSTPSAWSAGLTRLSWEETSPASSTWAHSSAPQSFHESLDCLLHLVRRDFILPWYSRISPSAAFPNAVDRTIRQSLGNLADRAQQVDWATLVVSKTVPLLKEHIEHFKRVEGTLSTARGAEHSIPLPPKHHPAVASRHTPSLAPAAVEAHVQKTVERLLGIILPPKDSASQSVRMMATEIVTMMILLPVIDLLSDGDFWNRLIEERGKRHLQEEKLVKKVLSALDSVRPPQTPRTPSKDRPVTTIAITTSKTEFDMFVRSLRKVQVLGKAKQYRADIEREIRRASDNHHQLSDSIQAAELNDYIERLQKARLVIEVRIEQLSGLQEEHSTSSGRHEVNEVTLRAVLANQASTMAWLEHMERRGKAVSLQFWLLAESLKDPLEALQSPLATKARRSPDSPDDAIGSDNGSTFVSDTLLDLPTSEIAQEDIRSLWYTYFEDRNVRVSEPVREVLRRFALDNPITDPGPARDALRGARAAVFEAQQEVYDDMVDLEWDDFRGSELYRRAMAELEDHQQAALLSAEPTAHPKSPPQSNSILKQFLSPGDRKDRAVTSTPGFTFFNRINRSAASASPSLKRPSISPVKSEFPSMIKTPIHRRQLARGATWASTSGQVNPGLTTSQNTMGELLASPEPGTRAPLFGDDSDEDDVLDTEAQLRISKRQQDDLTAALTTIIAGGGEPEVSGLQQDSSETPSENGILSPAASLVLPDRPQVETQSVSVSRVPLRATSTESLKKSLMDSSPLRPLNQATADDAPPINVGEDGTASDEEPLSTPLGASLTYQDRPLHEAIERLQEQEALHLNHIQQLQSYIDMAELHASDDMLRLCRQSMARVLKDLAAVQLRITNYRQQQEESRLVYGKTTVSIPRVAPANGVYWFDIIVKRVGQAGQDATTWKVTKRFSQFDDLKRSLSEWIDAKEHGQKLNLKDKLRRHVSDFPAKSVITKSNLLQEHRRQALEKYLQSLLLVSEFCSAPCVQYFFNRDPQDLSMSLSLLQQSLASATVDRGLSEEENTFQKLLTAVGSIGGQFVEDLTAGPTIMINSVQTALSQQAAEMTKNFGDFVTNESEAAPGFVQPLQDLCMTLLDYDAGAWNIRRPAVIGTLQAISGTIERQARASPGRLFSFGAVEAYLMSLRETLWPGGQRRSPSTPRSEEEKRRSRLSADKLLFLLVPDAIVTFCGKKYVRKGIRRSLAVLQDRRLNQHLILTILDDFVEALCHTSTTAQHTA